MVVTRKFSREVCEFLAFGTELWAFNTSKDEKVVFWRANGKKFAILRCFIPNLSASNASAAGVSEKVGLFLQGNNIWRHHFQIPKKGIAPCPCPFPCWRPWLSLWRGKVTAMGVGRHRQRGPWHMTHFSQRAILAFYDTPLICNQKYLSVSHFLNTILKLNTKNVLSLHNNVTC